MAISLTTAQQQTWTLLNEAANTLIAQLSSGQGQAPTITTPDATTYWLNQAAANVARTCLPIQGLATLTVTPTGTPTGTLDMFLKNLTAGNSQVVGGQMWAAQEVAWIPTGTGATPVNLRHCTRPALRNAFPSYQINAAAGPQFWLDNGQGSISVYPTPAAAGTLSVTGLLIPQPLQLVTDQTNVVPWLPDDELRLLTQWAAMQIALKNYEDDPLITAKLAPYKTEWTDLATTLWSRIDPFTRQAHFKLPPQGIQAAAGGPDEGGGGSTTSSIGV